MAFIKVNERDLSWYFRQRPSGQLVVLVPGVSTFGPHAPVLVTENDFKTVLGTSSVNPQDLSYNMAASFVKAGTDVLFWRCPLEGEKSAFRYFPETKKVEGSTDYESVNPKEDDFIIVSAKYAGTYGNNIKIKAVEVGDGYRFLVYDSARNSLLETIMVNLTDPDSENYYTTVNEVSNFIEISFSETLKNQSLESIKDKVTSPEFKIKEVFNLNGGSNGEYNVNDITDYLSGPESNDVFNDLIDPLSYTFNLVVDGGYNNYERRVDSGKIKVGSEDSTLKLVSKTYIKDIDKIVVAGKTYFIDKKNESIYFETGKINPETNEAEKESVDFIKLNKTKPADPGDTSEQPVESLTVGTPPNIDISVTDVFTVTVTYAIKKFSAISQIDDRLIALSESRGLATYLVSGGKDWTAEDFFSYTDLPKTDEQLAMTTQSSAGFNTSYAAAIGPWCSAQYLHNGVTKLLPGTYAFIVSWALSLADGNPMYYAPAGVKRARLNFVNSTVYNVGSAVLDLWQNQDITVSNGHKIIPITNLRQYGYVVYGNSTLLKTRADGSTSMLQSLSVRVLSNLIKTKALEVSLSLQFDQISDDLFSEFKTLMSVFMDNLKYRNALYDYLIVADRSEMTLDDLNSRTVPVIIRISPTPSADNFDINLEITQAGVVFNADNAE